MIWPLNACVCVCVCARACVCVCVCGCCPGEALAPWPDLLSHLATPQGPFLLLWRLLSFLLLLLAGLLLHTLLFGLLLVTLLPLYAWAAGVCLSVWSLFAGGLEGLRSVSVKAPRQEQLQQQQESAKGSLTPTRSITSPGRPLKGVGRNSVLPYPPAASLDPQPSWKRGVRQQPQLSSGGEAFPSSHQPEAWRALVRLSLARLDQRPYISRGQVAMAIQRVFGPAWHPPTLFQEPGLGPGKEPQPQMALGSCEAELTGGGIGSGGGGGIAEC